jgi:hypothetical protein
MDEGRGRRHRLRAQPRQRVSLCFSTLIPCPCPKAIQAARHGAPHLLLAASESELITASLSCILLSLASWVRHHTAPGACRGRTQWMTDCICNSVCSSEAELQEKVLEAVYKSVRPHHLTMGGQPIVGLDEEVDRLANTVLSWQVRSSRWHSRMCVFSWASLSSARWIHGMQPKPCVCAWQG